MEHLFINRHTELDQIKHTILDRSIDTRFILLYGVAGVGKTTILQRIQGMLGDIDQNCFLFGNQIIDFDDNRYKYLDGLLFEITNQLGSENFKEYLHTVNVRKQAEKSGSSPARLTRLSIDAEEMFVEDLKKFTKKKRTILRFDTAEKVIDPIINSTDEKFWDFHHPFIRLIKMILDVPNLIFIIAGRTTQNLRAPILDLLPDTQVLSIHLLPFSLEVSKEILYEVQRFHSVIIDPSWEEIFHYVSNGLPILLNMAIEWVERDSALANDWLSESNLRKILLRNIKLDNIQNIEELSVRPLDLNWFSVNTPSAFNKLQKEFKIQLVNSIINLRTLDDLLTLTLAKVSPLDIEGISAILNIPYETAEQVYKNATNRSNVKVLPDGRIRLTDAMEELVLEYVWPLVDLEGTREQRDNQRAINYLFTRSEAIKAEIEKLKNAELKAVAENNIFEQNRLYNQRLAKEQEFWLSRTEHLRRFFELDTLEAVSIFNQNFELADQFGYLVAREALIDVIKPYVNKLPAEVSYSVQQKIAQYLIRSSRYEEALFIYNKLFEITPPKSTDMVNILIGQGNCLMRSIGGPGIGASIRRAIKKYREAYRLSSNINTDEGDKNLVNELIARSFFSLGWSYRALGMLSDAEDYYKRCYRLTLLTDNLTFQALSANGMAYVFAIQKDSNRAEKYSNEAIDVWQKLIIERPANVQEYRNRLAQAYNTAGEISIELGKPLQARRYLEIAVEIFSELSIDEWLSKALSGRGYAKWMAEKERFLSKDRDPKEKFNWEDALNDLSRAHELATSLDAPLVLHRMAYIYWMEPEKEKAIDYWLQSNRLARQVGDMYVEYNSLCDLANVAKNITVPGYGTWHDFQLARVEYAARNPDVSFPLLDGLFFVYLGNLAILDECVDEAVSFYKRGLGILSRNGSYLDFNLIGQLQNIENEVFTNLKREKIRGLGETLLEFWQRPGSSEELSAPEALGVFIRWSNWE